eukprot:TRINITY_DN46514_c0_g1_i1.p1 TRINITY_DN46514_c0_g1~~TRINITY_DN46514_c0_g1_i1.p1  ORF type:complete len:264 (-),score=94.28 TRINITY_DN46514_c0_g1_i1:59-850(-)
MAAKPPKPSKKMAALIALCREADDVKNKADFRVKSLREEHKKNLAKVKSDPLKVVEIKKMLDLAEAEASAAAARAEALNRQKVAFAEVVKLQAFGADEKWIQEKEDAKHREEETIRAAAAQIAMIQKSRKQWEFLLTLKKNKGSVEAVKEAELYAMHSDEEVQAFVARLEDTKLQRKAEEDLALLKERKTKEVDLKMAANKINALKAKIMNHEATIYSLRKGPATRSSREFRELREQRERKEDSRADQATEEAACDCKSCVVS